MNTSNSDPGERITEHVAALWTGGKDSALALHHTSDAGRRVRSLITFVPDHARFLAHPLDVIKRQAQALGLPHYSIRVSEPYETGYEQAIKHLRDCHGVQTLVTGDTAPVDGQPNWIRQRARPSGVEVLTPLWDADREALLKRLIEAGFVAILSCVRLKWLGEEWLGTELGPDALGRLRAISRHSGMDLGGEQGEYHTLVIDGPGFTNRLDLGGWQVGHSGELAYLELPQARTDDVAAY